VIRLMLMYCLGVMLYGAPDFTNALIHEKSPYLIHHAHNPVNWYPYTPEAFAKAKKEHKLIFLSIGFSTCHWCHVMEKESFTNSKIAQMLNKDYISIKVDKEEMPDIDIFYQHIYTGMTGRHNSWPLSIIMTPDKEVLYASSYIPPVDSYGIPGLETLLPKYAKLVRENPEKIAALISKNLRLISQKREKNEVPADQNITERYVLKMADYFKRIEEDLNGHSRFPMASNLRLLLDIYMLNGDKRALQMVQKKLTDMAQGGIYDQIEGGFFRYATDPEWVIPHFEKMLYTNAELLVLYIRMWLLTGKPLFQKVVRETIAEYHRHLEKEHLFFGATDADSSGREGGYFVYGYDEVNEALKKADFNRTERETLMEFFDISQPGNFKNDLSNVNINTGFSQDEIPKGAKKVKKILRQLRTKREFPFIDKKIITSWNAMMIKALFKASVLESRYGKDAIRSLDALLHKNYKNGTLYHYTIGYSRPEHVAFLEDYAFLIDAVLEAYEHTYDERYLKLVKKLIAEAKGKFYRNGVWYLNQDEPGIKTRYLDKYYTSPLPRMFHDLLTFASLTYDVTLYHETKKMIADERERILTAFDKSPEALRVLIRLQYGDIIFKAKKAQLLAHKKEIAKVRYPFLLTKSEKADLFLLCSMESCFFYDKNLTKVLKEIKARK